MKKLRITLASVAFAAARNEPWSMVVAKIAIWRRLLIIILEQ